MIINIFGSADPGFSAEAGDRGADSTSLLVTFAMSDFKHTEYMVDKQRVKGGN
jgi:hypothetical protein